ncbi:hypothetical protein JCM19239_5454 [Vibrio variabilis]|uniref:DUF2961 domain-containing protein n=1 Tax=Vibrio variabilis TaxID=990271 RepID=A0ABQ0JHI0_9VIBR|nr:hypothetical protein JCM19239_5454 [Vibrio variabilis]
MLDTGYAEQQSSELGKGWKVNPATIIEPGATKVVADINEMGNIQSIWMTGHISRDLILRIYWDNQSNPSVEVPYPDFFAHGYCDNREALLGTEFQPLVSDAVCITPMRCSMYHAYEWYELFLVNAISSAMFNHIGKHW